MFKYIIQPYDTIYSIANNFRLDYKQIISANPQINNNSISTGQIIYIPGFLYKVQSQDTLNKISQKYNIPFNLLLSLNPEILYNGNISVGQTIFITNINLPNDILSKSEEIESNSNKIIEDIDKENWSDAENRLTLIKNAYNDLKPILHSESIPTDLINIIENSIISLETEIGLKNVHEAKVQAFIISEYFPDILDILKNSAKNK